MNKNIIDLGWHSQGVNPIRHLWHTRAGVTTAVSACGLICKDPLNFTDYTGPRCAACESMEEYRQLGLTGLNIS